MGSRIISEPVEEALRLIEEAERQNIILRALGGVAVKLHTEREPEIFKRDYSDIDLVVDKDSGPKVANFLKQMGYEPNVSFNTYNGHERQLYYDLENQRQLDIFVGDFRMCHYIPLNNRLLVEPYTIPRAELLLTKIQIVQMNHKDIIDLSTLMLNNEITEDDSAINYLQIAGLCSNDWGLYKTFSLNVERLVKILPEFKLEGEDTDSVVGRFLHLVNKVEKAPKKLKWKMRSMVGEKVPWYELPEEVHR
ncbi:MAG: nucleotidyltransferase family protein [Pelotomaculaceae bacterium]|jgi:hypothetical protein|uniref:Nucleotidyltransferase family protein n=1 Tax=anaerobic digester metagenome TaxID=1263854 RepID=A0A485LYV9_9ZZZZ|nr:nucleotidyltransferase family protein [Bacillota bacterium]HHU86141.1 nucleotidyltransferase family protein [Peptococcaceae bacterium]